MLPSAPKAIAGLATSAEIRSIGLHTLLSKRNRAAARQAGLTYSVHGPFGYTGIWDVDDTVRLEALAEHRRPGGQRRDRSAPLRGPPRLGPRNQTS